MDYEVAPEPSPEEREALERALERLLDDESHPAYVSRWRSLGIAENLGDAAAE